MLSCLIPVFQVFQLVITTVASVVLLVFAGLILGVSIVGLIVATPLFVVFSPILVPATLATTFLATGLTASTWFAVTAIALIIWLIKYKMGAKAKDNPPPQGAPPNAGENKPTEKPADKPADKPAEKPTDKPVEKPAEGTTDKPADKPAEGSTSKLGGSSVEKPGGSSTDKPAEEKKPPA